MTKCKELRVMMILDYSEQDTIPISRLCLQDYSNKACETQLYNVVRTETLILVPKHNHQRGNNSKKQIENKRTQEYYTTVLWLMKT